MHLSHRVQAAPLRTNIARLLRNRHFDGTDLRDTVPDAASQPDAPGQRRDQLCRALRHAAQWVAHRVNRPHAPTSRESATERPGSRCAWHLSEHSQHPYAPVRNQRPRQARPWGGQSNHKYMLYVYRWHNGLANPAPCRIGKNESCHCRCGSH